jgi:hypothetical protein
MKVILLIAMVTLPAVLKAQTKNASPDWSMLLPGNEGCAPPNKRVVFEVSLTNQGVVTKLRLIENRDSVSAESIKEMEDHIRKVKYAPTDSTTQEIAGKFTFCVKKY